VRRPVTIRRSLLVNLVVVLALLSAGLLGTAIYAARTMRATLSASLIREALDEAGSSLDDFFDPVEALMHLAPQWGGAGLLDIDQPDQVDKLLAPALDRFSHLSAVIIADSDGREHMLLRAESAWTRRQIDPQRWGDEAHLTTWRDPKQPTTQQRHVDYDPRQRLWYTGAVARRHGAPPSAGPAQLAHWTDPYTFFETQAAGITASVALPDGPGGVERVFAVDVTLTEISEFTLHLHPSRNGCAFVMTHDGQVIGLPRDPRFTDAEARRNAMLTRASEFVLPVVRDGTAAYFAENPADRDAYRFRSVGETWWGGCREFQLGDRTLLIAVGVPDRDLVGGLTRLRWWMGGLVLVVFGAAIWRAYRLAHGYSAPVEALVRESERMSRGDLEPGPALSSRVAEVQRLAQAHDRMREGLRTLLKLERDVQLAREIQQRTFPPRLPDLPGFELGAWADPADETGGDSYDVVGYRMANGTPRITDDDANRAILLLADATGHGIGPAISVTQVRSMLRMAVRAHESLALIVRHLNDQLCADLPDGRFVTAWLGLIDAEAGTLQSLSAGQGPILRYVAATGRCEPLGADTVPMGVTNPLEVKPPRPFEMAPGDIVAVISDGIFEAADAEGNQFGVDRVSACLVAEHASSPKGIIEALRRAVEQFTGGAPAADDQTGVIVKRASGGASRGS